MKDNDISSLIAKIVGISPRKCRNTAEFDKWFLNTRGYAAEKHTDKTWAGGSATMPVDRDRHVDTLWSGWCIHAEQAPEFI